MQQKRVNHRLAQPQEVHTLMATPPVNFLTALTYEQQNQANTVHVGYTPDASQNSNMARVDAEDSEVGDEFGQLIYIGVPNQTNPRRIPIS